MEFSLNLELEATWESVKTTVDVYPKPKELFKNNASPKSLVLSKDPFDGVGSNRWCWVRMLALGDEERANVEEDEEDYLYSSARCFVFSNIWIL